MWDTPGLEIKKILELGYCSNAIGVCIVFDVTDKDSFINCKAWVENLKTDVSKIIVIVGNKIDLENDQTLRDEAQCYAKNQGL
jgi:GTPase SAR1 family protein